MEPGNRSVDSRKMVLFKNLVFPQILHLKLSFFFIYRTVSTYDSISLSKTTFLMVSTYQLVSAKLKLGVFGEFGNEDHDN